MICGDLVKLFDAYEMLILGYLILINNRNLDYIEQGKIAKVEV